MRLNQLQLDILSKYLADVSKLIVASTVIAFFVPSGEIQVTIQTFVIGSIMAVAFLVFSVGIVREL